MPSKMLRTKIQSLSMKALETLAFGEYYPYWIFLAYCCATVSGANLVNCTHMHY